MFQEPGNVAQHVDAYIAEANSFWRSTGGQLDFATFIENRAKQTPRFKMLYSKKPGFMGHREYLSQFIQSAGAFGLSPRTTRQLVETGAAGNISRDSFQQRIASTREATVRNTGNFSQRFASGLAQLGGLGRG